jgi:predicted MPP superfamily phosphohydrolase
MPSKSVEGKILKEMEKFKRFSDKKHQKQLAKEHQKELAEEHQKKIAEIEKRIQDLKDKPNHDYEDEIWAKIYDDVLKLKKKSKK